MGCTALQPLHRALHNFMRKMPKYVITSNYPPFINNLFIV